MRYFYALIMILVLLSGCTDRGEHKNQVKYTFSDQNGQTFQIQSDFDTLHRHTQDLKENDNVTFIMFLDLASSDAKDYILHINHLKLTFPKADILGILTQPYSPEEIKDYIQANNVDFTLLNPKDSKNIFNDFAKKVQKNGVLKNTAQEAKESEENAPKEQNAEEQKLSLKIPYFVLYDKSGKKYQTYSGVVMEEMFAYDINTLLKTH
ncbi:hypothetical protein [Helicobacter sp. 11S02596-1]|uniref:hypothetical protein n=1 Tax=Helicobacter sp. 11S02596-1 TaxID=1476194 RepID=UPI000BA63627|nr:hypothetical protein [Helicobacter sp. 11S02596-1]PAF41639.1 hypothetical protein BJI48_08095 [Helicobacter sp. 11S02596-1]